MAERAQATVAIRVGGPNSGHTVITSDGVPVIFRHLPTACLLAGVRSVLPPGSYLSVPTLLAEIARAKIGRTELAIDPNAWVVTQEDVEAEGKLRLSASIGSTATGTGAALARRISRSGPGTFAKHVQAFAPYLSDTAELLADAMTRGERVVVEGTQGFGLSLLHSEHYPYCTSRDTTAAAFLSESGLSPLDVDDVVMVIRAYPIRVAGSSGPLLNETTWEAISAESGSTSPLVEHTTVTKKIRRVARFDADVVRRAIARNRPSSIVLNHLDYVDLMCGSQRCLTQRASAFVRRVEQEIGREIDWLGFGPASLEERRFAPRKAVNR